MDWDATAIVGRIVRPHGNRGHVVVEPETDFGADRFAAGARVLTRRGSQVEPLTVVASREQAGRWIVGLAGVTSISDAEALRGCELRIPAGELRPLSEGTFYLHDLAGCAVRTTAGEDVGTVARVDVNAGIAQLVVVPTGRREAEDEILVPFTDRICPMVDVEAKRIEIEPPDGLLDLNRRRGDRG